jgi:hypothetical protein
MSRIMFVRALPARHLRVTPKVCAGTPLGMGYGQTRFASPDKSFQKAGRLLSRELYNRFAVDGVLYLSRLTGAECAAVY